MYILVELPEGTNIIGSKWVFHYKKDEKGNVTEHRSWLVTQGFTQTHGIDYNDTFAPVAKLTSIHIILALAANRQVSLCIQMPTRAASITATPFLAMLFSLMMELSRGAPRSNLLLLCQLRKPSTSHSTMLAVNLYRFDNFYQKLHNRYDSLQSSIAITNQQLPSRRTI